MKREMKTLEDLRCDGVEDGALEEIDLGTMLDRVKAAETLNLLRFLAGKLKNRGRLRVVVTDFDAVVEAYRTGTGDPEKMLCGEHGLNRAMFNRGKLSDLLNMAGFEIVGGADAAAWKPNRETLSVVAEKRSRREPPVPIPGVAAVMSLPRIAWTETLSHTLDVCGALQMPLVRSTGVFWGQCLERMLEKLLEKGMKYALTVDYDSIFDARDVVRLWQIMEDNPSLDVLCPLQVGRDRDELLVHLVNPDGSPRVNVTTEDFYAETLDIKNGHFGLTMIRIDALRDVPHPWFHGQPNAEGRWHENRVDDDIFFWHRLRAAGRRVAVTPKVRIGHLQLVVTWPTDDCQVRHQYVNKYHDDGRPPECMTY